MNRIICDICGAEYPETVERCPVCNYPRQGTEKLAAAEAEVVRTKVKGGRFSSKNVKKRKKAQLKTAQAGQKNPNRPLIIVIILLLAAIVLVSAYIGYRFLYGRGALPELFPPKTTAAAMTRPTETTQPTEPAEIPCEGIALDVSVLDLEEKGEQKQLSAMVMPENTTDTLTFVSADPAVAQVSDAGVITAVGSGQTTITVTCGSVTKTCTVVCWFQEETTVPAEPTEPQETLPGELTLDLVDVTCVTMHEVFNLNVKLDGNAVNSAEVTWISSDPAVAKVENGTVTAVGKGTVTITAAYGGKKAECLVRCNIEAAQGQNNAAWTASHTDVSIAVGETFPLTVKNAAGDTTDAAWTASEEGVVTIDGENVTGAAPGIATLTTTVEGVTLTCIVRVN